MGNRAMWLTGSLRLLVLSLFLMGLAVTVGGAEAPVIFEAPNISSGLYLKKVGDGADVTDVIIEGRSALQLSRAGYMYFDVDNTYMFGGNYPYAQVEVDYYDAATLVGKNFFLQYDATTGLALSDRVFPTGTGTWQTAKFYLSNVRFDTANSILAGGQADFRLNDERAGLVIRRVSVLRSFTDLRPRLEAAASVSFQAPAAENGLYLKSRGDGIVMANNDFGRPAFQVSPSGYGYFDVDNSFISMGSHTEVTVDVSYYDKGFGFFYLDYDSSSSLATSTELQAAWQSFGPSFELQSNNIVYLTNSNTWKTYTFNLSNVYFGTRQMVSVGDLRLNHRVNAQYNDANMGYRLVFDKVTVTKSSTPVDRTGAFQGNYAGFGDPMVVWTRLAQVNEQGHGLWQNEAATSTTVESIGGEQARRASLGFIYFDVNDNYIKNGNANNVYVAVEYFDNGTNPFSLQYDSTGDAHKATETVARTGTNTWKRYTFYLQDGYFGNRQVGGSDFRLAAPTGDLYIKGVYALRAPGPYVQPRATISPPAGFKRSERVVAVHYFPVFDGHYPTLWEVSSMGPPGADATTHKARDYSLRDVATLKKDLEDMKAARIDAALVWYMGNTTDSINQATQAVRNLVIAAKQVSNPPKIGLLLDPVQLFHERVMKDKDAVVDLTTNTNKGLYIKLAEDFFSQVPSELWFTIEGRPVIALYYQGSDMVSRYDNSLMEHLKARFAASFGVQPYLIADNLWDPAGPEGQRTKGIGADEWFSWGAGLAPAAYPAFANQHTVQIAPGFKDTKGRVRDREDGAFYRRSWARALGKGNHLVLIGTWNYWVEGEAIAESAEYGRQYIDLTAQYAAQFKAADYARSGSAKVMLGATNIPQGAYLDEIRDGPTAPIIVAGQGARRATGSYLFFSVDDTFTLNQPTPVKITVKYYDADAASGGSDWFAVQYDGAAGAYAPTLQTEANTVDIKNKGNTKSWQTRTFEFSDALFANRQVEANDFRLISPGGLIVAEVTVTREAPTNKVLLPIVLKGFSR